MKKSIIVLLAFFAFTACKKSDNENVDSLKNGTLNVRLTDAPAAYDSVNIEITGVEVHSNQTGWVSMSVPTPGIYNLLQYNNGLDTLIATSSIPAGNVSQIRLIVGNNNTVTKAGQTYPLVIPSGSESGLKIQIHTEIVAGVTTIVLLDFDASRSIVEQGNGVFHLKPVLRAMATGIDGSITGIVSPAMNAAAYAISGNDTFTSVTDPATGEFLISSIPAGTYTLCIYPASGFPDTCISPVSVSNNVMTDVGVIQY